MARDLYRSTGIIFFLLGRISSQILLDRFEILQVRSRILNFFLLVLGIPLDLSSDLGHKQRGFFKTLPKKSFVFVPSKKGSIVVFNLGFLFLLAEVDLILEKQGCKRDTLEAHITGRIKMVFTLPAKIVAFYI